MSTHTFTPSTWTGTRQTASAPKLQVMPNSPFYLLHHPFSWELVKHADKWTWLPTFGQLHEIAGVNGIEETPQGPDSTVARMRLQDAGQTVIDREYGYLARYETVYGGYYYRLRWDVPKVIGRKLFWNTDQDGYNDWRQALVTEGIIDAPEIEVVQTKISMIDRKIDRRLKFQHVPEVKTELDELYELKKNMKSAYDSMHDKPSTNTKSTKGKRKGAADA
jgi:hypothetical protein